MISLDINSVFLQHFWIMPSCFFLASLVSDEQSAVNLKSYSGFLVHDELHSLVFEILFVFVFQQLSVIFLGVNLLEFILLGIVWPSCVYRVTFFKNHVWNRFGHYFLKYSFYAFFSLLPSGSPSMHLYVGTLDAVPLALEAQFIFHSLFFFPQIRLFQLTRLQVYWFFHLLVPFCHWASYVNISFQLLF